MPLTIWEIQHRVARHYGVTLADMTSQRRFRSVSRPRMVAMFLARKLLSRSYTQIARDFQKDHTTVIHAVRRIQELMDTDPAMAAQVSAMEQYLREHHPELGCKGIAAP